MHRRLTNNTFMEYITRMEWQVLLDADFKAWLLGQEQNLEQMEQDDGRDT